MQASKSISHVIAALTVGVVFVAHAATAADVPSASTITLTIRAITDTGAPWSNLDVSFDIPGHGYSDTVQTASDGYADLEVPDNFVDETVYVTVGPYPSATCAVDGIPFIYAGPGAGSRGTGWVWDTKPPFTPPSCLCDPIEPDPGGAVALVTYCLGFGT